MVEIPYTVWALLPVVAWLLYSQLRRWRFGAFAHIPHVFPPYLLFGNVPHIASGIKKLGDARRHPDYVFDDMWRSKGHPEIVFLDLRPVNWGMSIIASNEVAEQITRTSKMYPISVTKSPTMGALLPLIGKRSIFVAESLPLIRAQEATWKVLRKQFNQGFAPQHLLTLLPRIVDKTSTFMSKLDSLAKSGAEFDMEPLCTNVTFDIIGDIITNLDFRAQDEDGGGDIVKHFRTLLSTYADSGNVGVSLNIPKRIQRFISSRKADVAIKKCIQEKFDEIKEAQKTETKATKDRSVLALSLKDTEVLTPEILQVTADQVKSFLFAGHDTTSSLLQWLFYALSVHPRCLAAIRAEHDAVFGDQDPREVMLAKPDESMKALSYTSACIKEALRLWPPAGSARMAAPGKGFTVKLENGDSVCLDGTILYLCPSLIQRDPKVYGDTADDFVPERWLGDIDTSAMSKDEEGNQRGASNIPISAWRPFERGPRNCIGQELANLEARVIIASVMRRYDFIKVGAGEVVLDEKDQPILGEKGRYKLKSELFNSMIITSKPFDKTRMKVKLRSK
ncbi:cytochrome P450 52A12 [Corynespora cassiicola Philippines]|uniref:Cytochrome P450 52A12 n=1 Tax=Corynespora cassiicola Philippines TaxID=1448308 RepID=A0A2T2N665_CORCC|nr:cytochrome P450 52A12 [Corynespora cassiicola Philippines]